ncbi:hypothetical protein [Mycolicibacterium sp. XJ870]
MTQPPQWPAQPYPTPPKRNRVWRWTVAIGVVVALAVVAVAAVVFVGNKNDSETGGPEERLAAGQCVTSDDFSAGRMAPTDCDDPLAVYELAVTTDSDVCPDGQGAKGSYFVSESTDTGELRCFVPNLMKGECYLVNLADKQLNRVDCADAAEKADGPVRAFEMRERIENSRDTSQCGEGTTLWSFGKPLRLYCLKSIAN